VEQADLTIDVNDGTLSAAIVVRRLFSAIARTLKVPADDGMLLRAEDNGNAASARGVQSYVMRAFGDRLGEARAAMEALAASLPPEELNRVGFRLYERFRPDVPAGAEGWGQGGIAH
jgi:hypothetical protein